jgi:hypothetical protein
MPAPIVAAANAATTNLLMVFSSISARKSHGPGAMAATSFRHALASIMVEAHHGSTTAH